jgi:hypothetical protein
MGKIVVILGACLAAAGGVSVGLYTYADLSADQADIGSCPVVRGKCCAAPLPCCAESAEVPAAALAVAGPAALFAPTSPVSATADPNCPLKVNAHAACCDGIEGHARHGLGAVGGTVTTR